MTIGEWVDAYRPLRRGARLPRITSWRPAEPGGPSVAVHPLVSAAESIRGVVRWNPHQAPERRPRTELLRQCDRVRIAATEDEPIPWDLGDLPFAGLTRARARIVREVLNGYPVRFWSVNDEIYGRKPEGELGVFITIYVEGDWSWGNPLAAPYDMVIATSWDERPSGPACGSGTQRVMGLGALKRLEVLAMDPWDVCEACGCWRPRNLLVDVDRWFLDDPGLKKEYRPRLRCREVTDDAYEYCE